MKMTDIMKKSHSESKSENLDAILLLFWLILPSEICP